MLKRTVLALGRSVKEYFRAVQPITAFSTSLIHRVHERYKAELQPDQGILKSVFNRWKPYVTPPNDGIGLRDCRADNLVLQKCMVTSYMAVYLGGQEVQFDKDQPINICNHFPLLFEPFRNNQILESEPDPRKIEASPSEEQKDSSIRVIREVTSSSPALDKDFLHYLDVQKANRIQKEDDERKKVDTKQDENRKEETTASCGKQDRKVEQKSGKESKKKDKKKKSKRDIRKLREDCMKMEKLIKAKMYLKMYKALAGQRNKCKEVAANTKKCKKLIEAVKCKKQALDEKFKKMAEVAKKGAQNENPKKQAEKAKLADQKIQLLVAELKAMKKACLELTEKIARVKEAKRQELIRACQALVERDQREQFAKASEQRAQPKTEANLCHQKQCERLKEIERCRKIRHKHKLEKRANDLKKQWELITRAKKARKQAELEKCQRAKSAP
ncbi:testis-expressed protein 9 [Drosophila persimilis]|uniref:testis-expressed protein 9 n=1 Tax=Drosophila persimilis TaxID=7234 RepID=UPI000F096C74|nr:testis-expressed protein 9 [Drosophila persimilis]